MICIWNKQSNSQVSEKNSSLHIGADGKVYDLYMISMSGDHWLEREDVSDRYEVRYHLDIT